ncbi:AMP-forming long-chain acyl-CoA synthetase [Leptolyngbyaceae cyanobacterium JSC-12]|nr:AMP-forming long-chain acyl-CoA synthetase [Leptolyngbyaceae cyanobacterium JSC-12]
MNELIENVTTTNSVPEINQLRLGRSLPLLLDAACNQTPNKQALNQWRDRQWQSLSNQDFRKTAEEVALGLLTLGLERGDRIAFVMHSDTSFCIADMGSLLAGLVNVPIDLTQTIENILFILEHTQATVLIVSNVDLLYQISPYLEETSTLKTVIVAEVPDDWEQVRHGVKQEADRQDKNTQGGQKVESHALEECLQVPQFLNDSPLEQPCPLAVVPPSIQLFSLTEIQEQGRRGWSEEQVQQLRTAIAPGDLATILYIASETKRPRGVMLTHENISAAILAAFSSYPDLNTGNQEVALMFLPLTHIFARAFLYGHLAYGHSIYFSDPNHVVKHLKTVKPTILITVPRLIEKVYERILEQGRRLSKFDRAVFYWALKLATRYEIGMPMQRLYALQLKLADRLVFAKWRAIFGDRMKALICGGAALRADLTQIFTAAGVPLLQGYGLTETSAVVCYNRGEYNRAGTVGLPIPGVKLAIAADGEVLVKSPYIMQGYYRDPDATKRTIINGWLHTGDLGKLSPDGFLTLTGVKKNLFKLSTGKYVSPLPLEQELNQSPLVAQAVAVGANHKFCGMLIFPNLAALQAEIQPLEIDLSQAIWLQHPCIQALYQALIDTANCHLPYWSTVRKFKLINAEFTLENGLLNPDGTLNRVNILEIFAREIANLYEHDADRGSEGISEATVLTSPSLSCPIVPATTCPAYAQSLTHY